MATVEKTVDIIFNGVDNVSKSLTKIGDSVDAIGELAEPFANMADNLLALQTAIVAVGIAGATAADELDAGTKKMQASIGIPADEAERLEEVVKTLYGKNLAESITESADVVTNAFKRFGDVGGDEIQKITVNAASLSKVFDQDINATMGGAETLMKQFGISSDEAFDFMAKGFQKGLNNSDDFIESITEYSTQFSNGGATAGQFFSILETGLSSGVMGTDKAADAFKEFRVRIQDGSKTTQESLELLGINAEELGDKMAKGTVSAADAFDIVVKKLGETDDKSKQMQAGVGLLGTQFEDLGTKAVLSLDITKTKMDDLKGASDEVKAGLDTFGNALISAFKTIRVSIADLDIWDDMFSGAQVSIEKIIEEFPAALKKVDFSNLVGKFQDVGIDIREIVESLFDGADLTSAEGIQSAIQKIVDGMTTLTEVTSGIVNVFKPFADILGDAVSYFNSLNSETKTAIGTFLGMAIVIPKITSAMSGTIGVTKNLLSLMLGPVGLSAAFLAVGVAIGTLLRQLPNVDSNMQSTIESVDKFLNLGLSAAPTEHRMKLINDAFEEAKIRAAAAAKSQEEFNKAVAAVPREPLPKVYEQGMKDFADNIDKAKQKIYELAVAGKDIPENTFDLRMTFTNQEELEAQKTKIKKLREEAQYAQDIFSDDIEFKIALDAETVAESERQFKDLAAERVSYIRASVDEDSLKKAQEKVDEAAKKGDHKALIKALADQDSLIETKNTIGTEVNGVKYYTSIGVRVDDDSKQKSLKELADELPAEKKIKLAMEVEKNKVEAEIKKLDILAETAQSKFEWQAKLDIAEVEAESQKAVALAETMSVSFEATTSVLSDLFGLLSGEVDFTIFNLIKNQIEIQNGLQERQLVIQEKLVAAQIEAMRIKNERLKSGEPLINISTDKLMPHMQAFVIELVEFIQVKATESGAEALIGL